MRASRIRAAIAVAAFVLSACGGEQRGLAGYQREPAPVVGEFTLPDLANGGESFALRADPGNLLIVYFGYTNCPDFCPTTLSDVRLARQRIDEPERIDVAMITIDPDRDLPILADYVGGFFDDGHALGTDDPDLLAQVAAPFGTTYLIETDEDGEIEVGHRTDLYAVDDQGRLALTWQFGIEIDELVSDFEQLLEDERAMTRLQTAVLVALVALVLVGSVLIGRALRDERSTGIQIVDAHDAVTVEHEYLIPPRTADRIDAGETVEIVPLELVVKVGEAIRIVNADDEDHVVGVFFVGAGETLSQRFTAPGVLSGECTVHSDGTFTLRVEA